MPIASVGVSGADVRVVLRGTADVVPIIAVVRRIRAARVGLWAVVEFAVSAMSTVIRALEGSYHSSSLDHILVQS